MEEFYLKRKQSHCCMEKRAIEAFAFSLKRRGATAFCILMLAAIACACSTNNQASIPPRFISSPATALTVAYGRRHWRKHVRVRPNTFGPPPSTISTTKGSYCYLTNGGVVQPGWWPVYNCYMMQNDTIDFGELGQTPGLAADWYCSEVTWTSGMNSAGSMAYAINPSVTGQGDWNCIRTDIADVTMSRGTDSGGWIASGAINGNFTGCDTVNCASNFWIILLGLRVQPGPLASPWPTGAPTSIGSSYPSPAPSNGLVIVDNNNSGTVVSDGATHNSAIGLQMNLSAKKSHGGTPTNVQWTSYGGPAITSQTLTSQQAQDVTPGPSPNPNDTAIFYYTVGGSAVIRVSATVGTTPMNALALYNVEAPSSMSMHAQFNTPDVYISSNGKPWLRLGHASPLPLGPSIAGITSTYYAVSPPDFGGWYAGNRTVYTSPLSTPPNVTPYPSTPPGISYDDFCWIYNVDAYLNDDPPPYFDQGQSVTYGPTYDAPGYNLGLDQRLKGLSVNDQFTDSFLFRPAGNNNNNVWVTIGQLKWSWGGNVSQSGLAGQWTITPGTSFVSPGPGTQSSWLPYWPNYFQEPYACPSPNPTPPSLARKTLRHSIKAHSPQPQTLKGQGPQHVSLPTL
jgi:hypothetical protein